VGSAVAQKRLFAAFPAAGMKASDEEKFGKCFLPSQDSAQYHPQREATRYTAPLAHAGKSA
jgi:hypothetical protein